jgi:hypothetical protein
VSTKDSSLLLIIERIDRAGDPRGWMLRAKLENRYDLHFMSLRDLFLFPIKGIFFFSVPFSAEKDRSCFLGVEIK